MQGSIDPEREPAFRHSGTTAGHLFGMPEPVNRRSRVKMPSAQRRGEVEAWVKKTVSHPAGNCNRRNGILKLSTGGMLLCHPYCCLRRSGRTGPGTYETTYELGIPRTNIVSWGITRMAKQRSIGYGTSISTHPLLSFHSQGLLLSNSNLGSGTAETSWNSGLEIRWNNRWPKVAQSGSIKLPLRSRWSVSLLAPDFRDSSMPVPGVCTCMCNTIQASRR